MERKNHIVLNKLLIIAILLGALFLWFGVVVLSEGDWDIGIASSLVGLIMIVAPLILAPWSYRFDQDGITICYLFLQAERYLWNNIHTIEVTIGSSRSSFLDLLLGQEYSISGSPEGEKRFHMQGSIPKSRRTTRYINNYWDGTIDNLWKSSKKKKKSQPAQYQTDEVVAMERNARESFRVLAAPFAAEAAQMGLELRISYIYLSEEFDEEKSRPKSAYTYTAFVEISHPGETDEKRTVCEYADLLHVRLGKKSYRGVKNQAMEKELRESLTEIFKNLREQGLEAYIATL